MKYKILTEEKQHLKSELYIDESGSLALKRTDLIIDAIKIKLNILTVIQH